MTTRPDRRPRRPGGRTARGAAASLLVACLLASCSGGDGSDGTDRTTTTIQGDPKVALITQRRVLDDPLTELATDGTKVWGYQRRPSGVFVVEPEQLRRIGTLSNGTDKDVQVSSMAFLDDSLWLSAPGGLGGSFIQMDPADGKELARIESPVQPVDLLPQSDEMWATGYSPPTLLLLDPDKEEIAKATKLDGGLGLSLGASTPGALWVSGDQAKLTKFDAATGEIVSNVPLPRDPTALAASSTQVFAAVTKANGAASIIRVNAVTSRVDGNIDVDAPPKAMVVADGWLWAVIGDIPTVDVTASSTTTTAVQRLERDQLVRIDPKTLQAKGSIEVPGGTQALIATDDALWLSTAGAEGAKGQLLRIDPA